MTDPIATGSPVVSPVADLMTKPAAVTSPNPNGELGKDAFLKLLVAQLKYQDPSSPVDSSQFMAQTAAFTQVEKLTAMAADSSSSLALQQGLAASGLVGRTVTYVDSGGVTHEGVVDSASFGGSSAGPVLHIGKVTVPLSGVVAVRSGADAPAPNATAQGTANTASSNGLSSVNSPNSMDANNGTDAIAPTTPAVAGQSA